MKADFSDPWLPWLPARNCDASDASDASDALGLGRDWVENLWVGDRWCDRKGAAKDARIAGSVSSVTWGPSPPPLFCRGFSRDCFPSLLESKGWKNMKTALEKV